jgi:hypothetical protein
MAGASDKRTDAIVGRRWRYKSGDRVANVARRTLA